MKPQRPKSTRRPRQPRDSASSSTAQMSRSHAQELRRAGTQPSFQTKVQRALYWNRRLAQEGADASETAEETMSTLGHVELKELTQFEGANLRQATLEESDPNARPSETNLPGIDPSSGYLPPPPPTR